ncbi:MAG: hypothetical protein QW403_02040 [Candidatus Aenigmatarchaeota archaeon]
MKNKGFIFVVEMITAAIIIFILFNFFFPPISFQHNWDKALLSLLSRDIILSIERNNELYKYSFNLDELKETLYQRKIIPSSIVEWSETENAIKKKITIACKCPTNVINDLTNLLTDLKINEREIKFEIKSSDLTLIPVSDVLLIWGYNDLSVPETFESLKKYLADGNGIVEVSDIAYAQINADSGHREIFGLTTGVGTLSNLHHLEFSRAPESSSDIIYEAWKYLRVNFSQNYQFSNFLNYDKIIAQDERKVLLKADVKTTANEIAPAVVLNDKYGKAAWISDFSEGGINNEEKWILIWLLLWASNKHEKSGTKVPLGCENSYINVYNGDFFEVYAFTLGLGHP